MPAPDQIAATVHAAAAEVTDARIDHLADLEALEGRYASRLGNVASGLIALEDQIAALPAPRPWPAVVSGPEGIRPIEPGSPRATNLDKIRTTGYPDTLAKLRPKPFKFADLAYLPVAYGTTIDLTPAYGPRPEFGEELIGLKDDAAAAKIHALLALLGPDADRIAHRLVAELILTTIAKITALARDSIEQRKLVLAWVVPILAQTAELLGWDPADHPELVRFFEVVAWPLLDHPTGFNWHGSFSAAKSAAAGWTRNPYRLADAAAYTWRRASEGIYVPALDLGRVRVLPEGPTATAEHWKYAKTVNPSTLTAAGTPAGTVGEDTRDASFLHVAMGLGAYAIAGRTLELQGLALPAEFRIRLATAAELYAPKVLARLTLDGTGSHRLGWIELDDLLGPDVVPHVDELSRHTEIMFTGPGANGLIAAGVTRTS